MRNIETQQKPIARGRVPSPATLVPLWVVTFLVRLMDHNNKICCTNCDFAYYGETKNDLKTLIANIKKKAVSVFQTNSKVTYDVYGNNQQMDFGLKPFRYNENLQLLNLVSLVVTSPVYKVFMLNHELS